MTFPSEAPMLPETAKALSILEGIRRHRLALLQALDEERARIVPPGLRNSIHWNVGHLLHVQLAHWYVRRGLPLPVDPGFRTYFRDGKSPADYDGATPTFARLLEIYRDYSLDLAERYGAFLDEPMQQPFSYLGIEFKTVSDDLFLLIYHEGEHAPMLDRILRAVSKT